MADIHAGAAAAVNTDASEGGDDGGDDGGNDGGDDGGDDDGETVATTVAVTAPLPAWLDGRWCLQRCRRMTSIWPRTAAACADASRWLAGHDGALVSWERAARRREPSMC